MFRPIAATILASLFAMGTSIADAQLLRFGRGGGVSIRVPFVRVDVSPYGGTYVRAPFTRVVTPGSYRAAYPYPPVYPVYPVDPYGGVDFGRYQTPPGYLDHLPSSSLGRVESARVPVPGQDTMTQPDDGRTLATPYGTRSVPPQRSLGGSTPTRSEPQSSAEPNEETRRADAATARMRLRSAAATLEKTLARRRDDADAWLDFLDPSGIVDAIDRGESVSSLGELMVRYDGVVENPELASLYRAPGFGETRQWLRRAIELAEPASESLQLPPPQPEAEPERDVQPL